MLQGLKLCFSILCFILRFPRAHRQIGNHLLKPHDLFALLALRFAHLLKLHRTGAQLCFQPRIVGDGGSSNSPKLCSEFGFFLGDNVALLLELFKHQVMLLSLKMCLAKCTGHSGNLLLQVICFILHCLMLCTEKLLILKLKEPILTKKHGEGSLQLCIGNFKTPKRSSELQQILIGLQQQRIHEHLVALQTEYLLCLLRCFALCCLQLIHQASIFSRLLCAALLSKSNLLENTLNNRILLGPTELFHTETLDNSEKALRHVQRLINTCPGARQRVFFKAFRENWKQTTQLAKDLLQLPSKTRDVTHKLTL
eukprot:RCo021964